MPQVGGKAAVPKPLRPLWFDCKAIRVYRMRRPLKLPSWIRAEISLRFPAFRGSMGTCSRARIRLNAGAPLAHPAVVLPTAPALRLSVNGSFAAPSVNLKLVNGRAGDLFPVQLTLD